MFPVSVFYILVGFAQHRFIDKEDYNFIDIWKSVIHTQLCISDKKICKITDSFDRDIRLLWETLCLKESFIADLSNI